MKTKSQLKKENSELKRTLSVSLNKPLLKEIRAAIRDIEKGNIVSRKEFFKSSPLSVC